MRTLSVFEPPDPIMDHPGVMYPERNWLVRKETRNFSGLERFGLVELFQSPFWHQSVEDVNFNELLMSASYLIFFSAQMPDCPETKAVTEEFITSSLLYKSSKTLGKNLVERVLSNDRSTHVVSREERCRLFFFGLVDKYLLVSN